VDITTGPDGNLWTVTGNSYFGTVGRITPSGEYSDFTFGQDPQAVVTGPDGHLWLTDVPIERRQRGSIGRMSLSGEYEVFTDPTLSGPVRITPGPDGALWFTNQRSHSIGRITAGPPVTFIDVPPEHSFFADIEWLADSGVTGGYTDGTFRPGAQITRGSMAAFLYRYAGEPPFTAPSTPTFDDVPTNHVFYDEVEWAAAAGITGGYADGTFRPAASITRGSISAFFYRLAEEPPFVAPVTPSFDDVPISNVFYESIEWLADTGITGGYPDDTYRPSSAVTRGTFAAFLHRYDELP